VLVRDELGRLADAFDRMLERIELAFESQRRFISDASHELRTPLAVVRGQLELLGAQLTEAPKGRAELALDEVDRMNRIVEDLLLLARLDEGMHLELRPTEVDLVIQEAALRVRQVTGRPVTVDAESEVMAQADSDRLLQVLINLLTNATRHTEPDAAVIARCRKVGDTVVIEVIDTGEGIPTAELPYVFDRMYRGQRSRTKGRPGAGLGLGIVTSLVRAMDGQVAVTSAVGEGSTFTVTLPLAGGPGTEATTVMAL
jgi:signal transduction histidine kinase